MRTTPRSRAIASHASAVGRPSKNGRAWRRGCGTWREIEIAVGPQRGTLRQSLNHLIATEAQGLGILRSVSSRCRRVLAAVWIRTAGPQNLQRIVPSERVDEARSLDEEFSLAAGPSAPEFAVRIGMSQAIQRIGVEPLGSLIGNRKRRQHAIVVDEGEHAPARQVVLDCPEQFAHRRPERLPGRALLMFAEPRGARGLPVPPDSASPAFRQVVRAPPTLGAAEEVLCVAIEELIGSGDAQAESRDGDAGRDALINGQPGPVRGRRRRRSGSLPRESSGYAAGRCSTRSRGQRICGRCRADRRVRTSRIDRTSRAIHGAPGRSAVRRAIGRRAMAAPTLVALDSGARGLAARVSLAAREGILRVCRWKP